MIQDLALRWLVTVLFVFSAGVYAFSTATSRPTTATVISHSLHVLMAVAMAVMAWPRGAELPATAPMVFFLAAAVWFAVLLALTPVSRAANAYHVTMMLGMAWMYAVMGGLPLRPAPMDGMHGMHSGGEPGAWVGLLNWAFTVGFTAAAVFWLYRLVAGGSSGLGRRRTVGTACQVAMATGMAVMFAVMV